jgi:lysophospholipase L1-like esterase
MAVFQTLARPLLPPRRAPVSGVVAALLAVLLPLAVACSTSRPPAPTGPTPAPLALTCPAPLEVSLAEGSEQAITYTPPVTAGGLAPVSVNCGPPSGSSFGEGTSIVTCTAQDAAGSQASCTFGIIVRRLARLRLTSLVAFGDSATEGKLSRTLALLVDSPAHSYPAALSELLREHYPSQTFTVMNAGYGGERAASDEARLRMGAVLRTYRPEVVLLMHGINDLIGDGLPGVQRAVDGLEDLVKEAVNSGARTFVATLPPFGPRAGCVECIEPFNAGVRRMVQAKGGTLVDVYQAWGDRSGLMGADGFHPTAEGYEAIAEAFFDSLRDALEVPGS